MARPKTLITDCRDLPPDVDVTGPSLAAFLASIVTLCSLEGPHVRIRSPFRCRCRPRRRACPGVILVDRLGGAPEIRWRCSECEFNGVITHWEGSAWDVGTLPVAQSAELAANDLRRASASAALAGRWRIVAMELWDADAMELLGPAFIELKARGGSLRFVAVEGSLDCRFGDVGDRPSVEFSWLGSDDRDAACGRGWAQLQPDGSVSGRIFIHDGDDSSFTATRFADS